MAPVSPTEVGGGRHSRSRQGSQQALEVSAPGGAKKGVSWSNIGVGAFSLSLVLP